MYTSTLIYICNNTILILWGFYMENKEKLYFNVCFTWYFCTVFLDKLVHDKSDNIRISSWVCVSRPCPCSCRLWLIGFNVVLAMVLLHK